MRKSARHPTALLDLFPPVKVSDSISVCEENFREVCSKHHGEKLSKAKQRDSLTDKREIYWTACLSESGGREGEGVCVK